MANEDRPYLQWLAWRPCLVCGKVTGSPPHHPRHNVGMGMRAHDWRAVPLCHQHHEDAQGYKGFFREMGKDGMAQLFNEAADRLREEYMRAEACGNKAPDAITRCELPTGHAGKHQQGGLVWE